jgi:hypothetical protein
MFDFYYNNSGNLSQLAEKFEIPLQVAQYLEYLERWHELRIKKTWLDSHRKLKSMPSKKMRGSDFKIDKSNIKHYKTRLQRLFFDLDTVAHDLTHAIQCWLINSSEYNEKNELISTKLSASNIQTLSNAAQYLKDIAQANSNIVEILFETGEIQNLETLSDEALEEIARIDKSGSSKAGAGETPENSQM